MKHTTEASGNNFFCKVSNDIQQYQVSDIKYKTSSIINQVSDIEQHISGRHEKGVDTQTLSTEIIENFGNFLIVEDYAPLFSEEMFDETFNIWHIHSL